MSAETKVVGEIRDAIPIRVAGQPGIEGTIFGRKDVAVPDGSRMRLGPITRQYGDFVEIQGNVYRVAWRAK